MRHPDRAETHAADGSRADISGGFGRILVTIYLVLAIAATLRAIYQIIRKFEEAPVAYCLSLLSGLVYVVATLALLRSSSRRTTKMRSWRAVAWCALGFELIGVLVIGTLSLTHAELFAHPSVWSWYGSGYLFVPLILPILGMLWLSAEARAGNRQRPHETSR